MFSYAAQSASSARAPRGIKTQVQDTRTMSIRGIRPRGRESRCVCATSAFNLIRAFEARHCEDARDAETRHDRRGVFGSVRADGRAEKERANGANRARDAANARRDPCVRTLFATRRCCGGTRRTVTRNHDGDRRRVRASDAAADDARVATDATRERNASRAPRVRGSALAGRVPRARVLARTPRVNAAASHPDAADDQGGEAGEHRRRRVLLERVRRRRVQEDRRVVRRRRVDARRRRGALERGDGSAEADSLG